MPARWTKQQEYQKRDELEFLYVKKNLTIAQVGKKLGISSSTVYDRLLRLNIKSIRDKKLRYNNQRNDICIPTFYTKELAEFIGILLGDGSLTPTQVTVTLGTKEQNYAIYVAKLVQKIFGIKARIIENKYQHRVVYIGSVKAVRWLLTMGLAINKVKAQVDVPPWIFTKDDFMRAALRGLIDTDGSIYRLRYGLQIEFCNRSIPLLHSARRLFIELGFHPSQASGSKVYLTNQKEIKRFVEILGFSNQKHSKRYKMLKIGCVA